MKTLLKTCLAAALLGFATCALATPTLELRDGSRIQGEIQGISDGVYTVLSPSLGVVHVEQSNIVRIVYSGGGSDPSPARDDETAMEIRQLQESLVQDAGAMASILSLQSDPQIQALLQDPAIVQAIQAGDYASLLGNPKIRALENNEKLQQLLDQQAR